MLVQGVDPVVAPRAPSILDSPTLARVERARMRNEGGATPDRDSLQNATLLSRGGAIKRGLLWQQRDRLFSRWKERYFILTRDYLHCFKRDSGGASDMGEFIFKVKLVEVVRVEWLNRRSYSAVCLDLGRDGRVLLRSDDGLEDWFELLEECTLNSKERRRALRIAHEPRSRASLAVHPGAHSCIAGSSINSALEDWLLARHKTVNSATSHFPLCDSVPDLSGNGGIDCEVTLRRPQGNILGGPQEFYKKPQGPLDHRLSLLTDIDIAGCDSGLDTPPSSCKEVRPSSYRDVFFMATPNMINDSPRRRSEAPYKQNVANLQSTNSSGSNCGNTNTGGSSSRGTMLTPGGSIRSNASKYNAIYNGSSNGNGTIENKNENDAYHYNKNINNKQDTTRSKSNGLYINNSTSNTKFFDVEDRYYNDKYYNYDQQNTSERIHQYLNDDRFVNGTTGSKGVRQQPAVGAQQNSAQILRFRDRSYSDIQHVDKRQWHQRQDEVNTPRRGTFLVSPPTRV